MATLTNSASAASAKSTGATGKYLIPFALVCSLFFLWGFAISMLDGLNRKFQLLLNIDRAESAWVQVCTFGAYFLMALPAGLFMKRYGYKRGIVGGLFLYSLGALLVYPALEYAASPAQAWVFFLISLFVLACGLAFLETAANPYTTVLGPPETAEFRINLAQSFNGVGVISGPLVGGLLLFSGTPGTLQEGFDSVQLPYVVVGLIVALVMALFMATRLPEITEDPAVGAGEAGFDVPLSQQRHFTLGVLAQFVNVGGQACVWGFFINYMVESFAMTDQRASYLLSAGMIVFMVGRFVSTFLMRYVPANRLLGYYGTAITALLLVVTFNLGDVSLWALMAFFFFQSITFPTIFALAVKDTGNQTKLASSFVIMGIVGGAAFPPLMGLLADRFGIATSFWLPVAFFAYIAWYAFRGSLWRASAKPL
jgi:MFS transporter, FHS family, L-fucose permease